MKQSLFTALLALMLAVTQNSQDPLRDAMKKRIDEAKLGTGTAVGLLNPEGRSFASYGRVSAGGKESAADTIVEIGSIGKVFTSLLLADMVERGQVALNDPVRKYLPTSVKMPSYKGEDITFADLATHTSGLPRDSVPVDMTKSESPYVGYTTNQLYAFLAQYELPRDPGAKWEYSNVGIGLLGHVLALRAGMNFEDLMRQRIFEPLGMKDTGLTFNSEQQSRRALGHNGKLVPVPYWTGGVVAPAGGFNSTAADLLAFGAAVLDPKSPLKAAFARMLTVKRPIEGTRTEQALGWNVFKLGNNEILAHDGGTFGFQARFIVDTTRKRAVIVWVNGRSEEPLNAIVGLALDRPKL